MSFRIPRLTRVSFGTTELIRVSFEITRLICVSDGITRLICESDDITRLICVSFGITRLIDVCVLQNHYTVLCKGNARGKPARGKKDLHRSFVKAPSIPDLLLASRNHRSVGRLCPYRRLHPLLRVPSGAAQKTRAKPQTIAVIAALSFRPLSRAAKDSRSRVRRVL
ncbi:hypothetical protein E5676_scaffold1623G00060 [Cucumis melo var. makuwa]|uniref:Uncharacterized protein n=1 Tax=Cucumis melo var. makuwa TaxID=1194695 RepID=A0A5D3CSK1_CUCMM|nr:hypothetical protein E5676_scaffold1623G00060 [Cucumis melo var. makuwa]